MSELRLEDKFPNLQPIDSAPSLSTVNGIGPCLRGRRDEDAETGTYVSTLCFCAAFIPLFCARAYRVADAGDGSYYFLGREPLSGLAKAWNAFMVFAALAGISLGGYSVWYFSPDAIALRQLAKADRLAAAGELAGAADICQRLVLANVARDEQARQRLVDWLEKPPVQAPAKDKLELWRAALRLHDAGQWPHDQDALVRRALELAEEAADADPAVALEFVEASWPLVDEPLKIVARVRSLLERAGQKLPGDLRLAVQLAITYDLEQNDDECQTLLAPHADKLASTEGARILGQIEARRGNFEQAYVLLSQYCRDRLEKFKAAEERWTKELVRIQESALAELREGKAGQEFYAEYDKSNEERKSALIDAYINEKIKGMRGVGVLREEFSRAAAVVPVALDFGMVQLERAQGMSDPAARQAELQSAEKTFLAIQNAASDSPQFQLSMAKVSYWLGKQQEGKQILSGILAAPDSPFDLKISVANVMRELGLEADAKTLLEKLYQTANNANDRANAALFRALLCDRVDEEIVWLERSPDSQERRASLSRARGVKLLGEGDEKGAEQELRKAAEAYSALPQNSSSLNNGAVCYHALFYASGKRSDLDEASTRFGKAVALIPDDSILVVNTARVYFKRAIAGIVEPKLDLRLMSGGDDLELLRFLYRDEAGQRAIVTQLRSNPELAQATRHFDRGALLAPKRAEIYDWFVDLYDYVDDKESLARLKQRIIEAQPETGEQLQESLAVIRGAKDQEVLKSLSDAHKVYRKLRDQFAALPPGEKRSLSLAVANHQILELTMAQQSFGQTVKLDEAVKLAEESVALAPSSATDMMLAAVVAARAHHNLAKKHPAYRRFAEGCRRTISPAVAVYLALDDPELRKLVLADADFRRSADLNLAHCQRFPGSAGAWDWLECRFSHPDQAEALLAAARRNEQERLTADIRHLLAPGDVHGAAFRAAIFRCQGREDQAQQVWKQIRGLGILVPAPVLGTVAGK